MKTTIFYLRDLSLLLFAVFYCNSLILVLDRFLHHFLAVLISAVSLTSLCHLSFHYFKLGKLFDTTFWSVFNLVASYFTTSSYSTSFTSAEGRLLVIIGVLFLFVYCVWVRYLSCFSEVEMQEQNPGMVKTPLLLMISFCFTANGVVLIGRGFIPDQQSIEWTTIGGAAVMLSATLFFFYSFVHCSTKIERDENRPHTEQTDDAEHRKVLSQHVHS